MIFNKIKNFYNMCKALGLKYSILYKFANLFRLYKYKNRLVYNYTHSFFESLLNTLSSKPSVNVFEESNKSYIIWVCWWQGEDNMPPIVKACYKNTLQKAGDNRVQLVTLDNYFEFVSIPKCIIDKVDSGQISLTHFSDILRVNLLADHGGLWLDATIYLTQPIAMPKVGFFTVKQQPSQDDLFISNRRWTGFCMGGLEGNVLFIAMKRMFNEYWQSQVMLPDYLFIDYCICVLYDYIPSVKVVIDSLEYSNPNLYYLRTHLNDKFDLDKFNEVCKETSIFKLTWKGDLNKHNSYGHQTYYDYIVGNYNKTSL